MSDLLKQLKEKDITIKINPLGYDVYQGEIRIVKCIRHIKSGQYLLCKGPCSDNLRNPKVISTQTSLIECYEQLLKDEE